MFFSDSGGYVKFNDFDVYMTVGGGARLPLRTVVVTGGGFSIVAVVLLLFSLNFDALKKAQ